MTTTPTLAERLEEIRARHKREERFSKFDPSLAHADRAFILAILMRLYIGDEKVVEAAAISLAYGRVNKRTMKYWSNVLGNLQKRYRRQGSAALSAALKVAAEDRS